MKKKMSLLRIFVHGRGLPHKIQAGLLLERESYGSIYALQFACVTMYFITGPVPVITTIIIDRNSAKFNNTFFIITEP